MPNDDTQIKKFLILFAIFLFLLVLYVIGSRSRNDQDSAPTTDGSSVQLEGATFNNSNSWKYQGATDATGTRSTDSHIIADTNGNKAIIYLSDPGHPLDLHVHSLAKFTIKNGRPIMEQGGELFICSADLLYEDQNEQDTDDCEQDVEQGKLDLLIVNDYQNEQYFNDKNLWLSLELNNYTDEPALRTTINNILKLIK